MVTARMIALAAGYVFGLFQTAYIYGRTKGVDIRREGSGNAGTTNSLRVFGWKAGLITFLGDFCKSLAAMLLIWLLYRGSYPDEVWLLVLYAGLGSVLGHNFPFYLNFKGGKGIACTSAVILFTCPYAAPLCLLLFVAAVGITRYVSLGSILVVSAYLVQLLVFGQTGILGMSGATLTEFYIVGACFTLLALWRHRANIVRLLRGTENKFGGGKEKEHV